MATAVIKKSLSLFVLTGKVYYIYTIFVIGY